MMLATRLTAALLCISAVAFLLRVLVALLKEEKCLPPRVVKVYLAKFNPSNKRGELIVMNPESRKRELPIEAGKGVAFMVLAAALLALPARAQQLTSSAAVDSRLPSQQAGAADQQIPPAIAKELEAMKLRIAQLEGELKGRQPSPPAIAPAEVASAGGPNPNAPAVAAPTMAIVQSAEPTTPPAKPAKAEPFAFADWTWLNGSPRTKDIPLDTKFFTPEIRSDVSYILDFAHPQDHTIGGSSEVFRSGEVQLTQLGVGGDFHFDNVRARLMTQFGMYAATTPRNDASPAVGQWDLDTAYRYISEAYGGYHFNVLHGVNVDAGIFMSYIGLFSYYNFDNWAYQPSYVSSNTPWFFNGVRVQIFPTEKLKVEPWFINGWQSYGKFNHRPGVGGQINWRPTGKIDIISNNYGLGTDALGVPNRSRYHTDNSIEVKYYDRPGKLLDKMAFSLTGDAGCESGGGVNCSGNSKNAAGQIIAYKQDFLGFMVYNRFWFHKDLYGFTVGGGKINNPGRYLVLLPPINGATAASGTSYFTENPGDPYKAWDASATFDYMPSQYITFRWEYDHRAASVPYFTGSGGITPPGGNTGARGSTVAGWTPDLVKDENRLDLAILVKF